MAGEVVAYLEVQLAGCDPNETQFNIEIRGNEQFYLGRNPALCRHHWPDAVISNKHLRVHCVLFEKFPVVAIPPLVYATDVSSNGTYLKKRNSECAGSQDLGFQISLENGSFLLDEGDELRLSDSVTLIYHSLIPVRAAELTAIQEREKLLFASRYLLTDRVLGTGGYGTVMVAIHQKTQRQVACKVIDLRYLYSNGRPTNIALRVGNLLQNQYPGGSGPKRTWPIKVAKCFREFDILKDLSHPNIIAIEKVLWSSNSIYIFEELVTGGDLFSYIEFKGGRLHDVEAAVVVRQILKGIEYLHDLNIVHRDLKPDNILLTSLDDSARVVITDFGSARYLTKDLSTSNYHGNLKHRMYSYVGTLEYTAPEIHKANQYIPADQGYSKSVDMWSIGSITVALIAGDVIFTDRAHPDYDRDPSKVILSLASRCDLHTLDDQKHKVWGNVGSRPKDFIKHLLVLREEDRLTATEALHHPWFSSKCYVTEIDALYERSVRDWQPRRKVFRLIEPIAISSSDNLASTSRENNVDQEFISRFVGPPPRSSPHHDIAESLSTAQCRRTKTPLPSIQEEYDEGNYGETNCYPPESYKSTTSSYNKSHVRPTSTDSVQGSMDQLKLDSTTKHMHTAVEYSIEEDIEYDEQNVLYTNATPEHEQDYIIIPETPTRSACTSPDHSTSSPLDLDRSGVDEFTDALPPKNPYDHISKKRKFAHA